MIERVERSSLIHYFKNLKFREDPERRQFVVGDFLPADHPAGVMETVNRIQYARQAASVRTLPDFDFSSSGLGTSVANAPLTLQALANRFLSWGKAPARVRMHFPGIGCVIRSVEDYLTYLLPRYGSESRAVLSDYAPYLPDPLPDKFPALRSLKEAGRLDVENADFRFPPDGFFQGPTLVTANYFFDSFPSRLIRKQAGKYYEVLFRMILPYDVPQLGGDCYDSDQQRENILRTLERARETGKFDSLPREVYSEWEQREITDLKEYPFGEEMEAVARDLDRAVFHINNQALESVLQMARLLGAEPWLLQTLDLAKPDKKSLSQGSNLIVTGENQFCWVDLTSPLWQEVLTRRGLNFSIRPYREFMKAALGYPVGLIESLLIHGQKANADFFPAKYLSEPLPLEYVMGQAGSAIAQVVRSGELFLTAQGNEALKRALTQAGLDPKIMDYLIAHIDDIWKLDKFHSHFDNPEPVNLYYIEISNR